MLRDKEWDRESKSDKQSNTKIEINLKILTQRHLG